MPLILWLLGLPLSVRCPKGHLRVWVQVGSRMSSVVSYSHSPYILADVRSHHTEVVTRRCSGSPSSWARRTIRAWRRPRSSVRERPIGRRSTMAHRRVDLQRGRGSHQRVRPRQHQGRRHRLSDDRQSLWPRRRRSENDPSPSWPTYPALHAFTRTTPAYPLNPAPMDFNASSRSVGLRAKLYLRGRVDRTASS